MPSTNPKTPKGWQRVRVHGGLAFVRKRDGARVQKNEHGDWRISRGTIRELKSYHTWWDAVQAADGFLEPRKESNHG